MPADEEDKYIIAQASEPVDKEGRFINDRIRVRHREEITVVDKDKVNYVDVSPKQLVSVAAAMIPFLEHDDVKRSLMGSKHATSSSSITYSRITNCRNRY
jgi:rpoB: DNA-directed RNA polymerase, beta subunit